MQLPPRDDDWQRSTYINIKFLFSLCRKEINALMYSTDYCNAMHQIYRTVHRFMPAHTLFSRKKKEAGKRQNDIPRGSQVILLWWCVSVSTFGRLFHISLPTAQHYSETSQATARISKPCFCSSGSVFCCMWSSILLLGFVVCLLRWTPRCDIQPRVYQRCSGTQPPPTNNNKIILERGCDDLTAKLTKTGAAREEKVY